LIYNINGEGIPWEPNFLNKIRISGFKPEKTNYKGISVGGKTHLFKAAKSFLTTKKNILEVDKRIVFPNAYITGYIDVSNLDNKKIYWVNQDDTLVAMIKSNMSNFNKPTSYRQFMPIDESTLGKMSFITYTNSNENVGVYLTKG
jgi:hypothetical protein